MINQKSMISLQMNSKTYSQIKAIQSPPPKMKSTIFSQAVVLNSKTNSLQSKIKILISRSLNLKSKLKNKSSPGPYGIPASLVKYLFKIIPNILTNALKNEISNKPNNTSYWRVCERKIIVIKKKNYLNKTGFSGFCPISL